MELQLAALSLQVLSLQQELVSLSDVVQLAALEGSDLSPGRRYTASDFLDGSNPDGRNLYPYIRFKPS
jgi:hypothetical protein